MGWMELGIPLGEICAHVRKRYFQCAAIAVMVLLVYGKQAFSTDFYVDAEVFINTPHTVYNWDQIGRFGLIALKLLIGGNWYNPYFEAVLFLTALWGLGVALCSFLEVVCSGVSETEGTVAAALFLVFPTYADQFMFRFQSFEIVAAMLLIVLAARYFYLAAARGNYAAYAIAVLLDVFSFGIYQSMVNLQLCFYIAVYLFSIADGENAVFGGTAGRKRLIRSAVIQFLISLAVYEIIAQFFFSGGSYLSGQVGWFSGDVLFTVRNLLAYVKRILLAMDVFYPVAYPVGVCGVFAFLIWVFCRSRQKFLAYFVGFGALLASPFFLALVTGTPSAYRAQCMLPFVCAVIWLFFARWFRGERRVRYLLCVAAGCCLILSQASVLMRMFYTQDTIRDADRITAAQIIDRVQQLNAQDMDRPVVFTGHLDAKTNGACYTKAEAGSFLSYSVYEFAYVEGVPIETPDYFNTGRILGYFKTLGFEYTEPSVELVEAAKAVAAGMHSWPAADSVRETPDYILIKLSD